MKKWLRVKVLGSRSRVQTQVSAGPSLSKDAPLPCPCMVIHIAPVPRRTLAAISGIPLPREHAAVRTGSKEVSAGRAAWNSISGPALCPLVVEGKGVKEPGRIPRLSGSSHDPSSDTKNGPAHHGPQAPSLACHLLWQQRWLLLHTTMKLISCL